MALLEYEDLTVFLTTLDEEQGTVIVADVLAQATIVAPCVANAQFATDAVKAAAVKAILRGAAIRWYERLQAGSGAVTMVQQTAGSFSQMRQVDTKQPSARLFWPSEIVALQELCAAFNGLSDTEAFMIDMTPDEVPASLASRPDLWFQWLQPTPHGAP